MKKFALSPLNIAMKKGLYVGSIAASLALSPLALAQEQGAEENTADVEKIMVTGSRIATDSNLFSSTPVQGMDAEDVKMSGEFDLADVVNDIPALVSSITGANSDGFAGDTRPGSTSLNLRGLGSDRTLTLVNGRRHVAGFRGSQAVDIGSIPRALVERVEVTTGGASAVYGADAVTGVVNFIMKTDFEGMQLDLRGAAPEAGEGENFGFDFIYGHNFDDDKGNIVFTVGATEDTVITYGDRDWARDNGIDSVRPRANPAAINDPNAPPEAVVSDPRFWLTSQEGSIAPTFGGRDVTYVDINGNGIPDCQESEGGRTGFLAGCWLTNPDGSVRVNQDGIVLGGLWGTGGDGGRLNMNRDYLLPETDKVAVNLNGTYEFSDDVKGYFESKYVRSETTTFQEIDTFYDTLFIQADNPFIPTELQPVVAQTGGLLLTQDPVDFSDDNPSIVTRETTRFVAGVEWFVDDVHRFDFSINHGRFQSTERFSGLYLDRVFAAMDVTTDANGNPVCRSDLDPTAAYEIDYFTAGNGYADGGYSSDRYYSFTPGDGQCAPLNPFGTYSTSQEARDFITNYQEDELTIKQTIVAFIASGEFEILDSILDGPLGYAAGIEYREETSDFKEDPLALGILPEGTSFTPGVDVNTIDPFLNSFISIDNVELFNTYGEYDVTDLFTEIRLPIFQDRDFAYELTLDAAIRVADYSTLGNATTWKAGLTYSPYEDLTIRSTISEAVRAPNISELFDPRLPLQVGANEDPCDPGNINGGTSVRQANCVADLQAAGVPLSDIVDDQGNYIWVNPLTGRFTGVSGGNPNLDVETADTLTVGVVFQPAFLEGFTITLDYWDIEIEDAISAVDSTDVLAGCLDSASYPNLNSCDQFIRRSDGGLTDLETGEINFARQEASGIDFAVNYDFTVDKDEFALSLVGSKQNKMDNFFNPVDLTEIDSDLQEIRRPELSAKFDLGWTRDALSLNWSVQYQGKQAVDEIEKVLGLGTTQPRFGDDGFFDEMFIHNFSANYELDESFTLYGGINNVTDEEPYSTQTAWPVGPRGRTLFLGVTYRD